MGTRREPLQFVCRSCGKYQETYSTGNKGIYCNKACRADFERKGPDAPCRYKQNGYWMLSWNVGGKYHYQLEHRRFWEDANGPIPDGYVIHHKNHDRGDNRLENLQLMRRGDHSRHHMRQPDVYPERGTAAEYTRKWRERHPEYKAVHAANERKRRARRKMA